MNYKNHNILLICVVIIWLLKPNDNLLSQITFSNQSYPDSILLNMNNYLPILKNCIDTIYVNSLVLSNKHKEIISLKNDFVQYGKDSVIVTSIVLNKSHAQTIDDNIYIIKKLGKSALATYSADTLLFVKKNNILIFVFISEWRGIYTYEAFSFHKAYRYVDRNKSFWRYDIDKDDYIDIENITVVEEKGKYYLIYKIINEKTKEFKMVKKRMEY